MILRCTSKLLAVIRPAATAGRGPEPGPDDWYANLLWFDRRKCLLLTHSGTLFTIFEADVTAAALRDTHRLATSLITRELRNEGLPAQAFGDLAAEDLVLAKTADRSVLGCMNDMAWMCEIAIADSGGLTHTDLAKLNHTLHRNINSPRGYQRPIDLALKRTNI